MPFFHDRRQHVESHDHAHPGLHDGLHRRRFDPQLSVQLIERERCTALFGGRRYVSGI